jgi:hypothetical protein
VEELVVEYWEDNGMDFPGMGCEGWIELVQDTGP